MYKKAFALILVCALILFPLYKAIYSKLPPKTLYVAVLPPELNSNDRLRYLHVVPNIKNAIEQTIIDSRNFSLIPERELKNLDKSTADIGRVSGADILLQTKIDCMERRCEVALSRIDKQDWIIAGKTQWPILVDKVLNNALITRRKLIELLGGELLDSDVYSSIDEQSYRDFVSLHTSFSRTSGEFDLPLAELKILMTKAPLFFPLYRSYSKLAFQAYDHTHDDKYIQFVTENLLIAGKLFPESYELSKIWLDVFLLKKEFNKAKSILEKLKQQGMSEDYVLYYAGLLAFDQQQYKKAISALSDAITLRPRESYYNKLVLALWMHGDMVAVREGSNALLEFVPESEFAHAMLGNLAMIEGDIPEAILVYQRLVSFHQNSQNHSDLGLAYMINQNYEAAREQFILALEYAENNSVYMANLADVEQLLGRANIAKELYEKIIAYPVGEGEESLARKISLAQAYAHTQNSQQAIELVQDLLAGQPDNPNILYTAALVYSVLKQEKTALVFFKRAGAAGISPVWFQLPFFRPLCRYPEFEGTKELNDKARTQTGTRLCPKGVISDRE